ncbi:MAG: copper chaperone PCu(A)C [Anaerolineales bacterium]|jgi:hypothetical protein|nr:copper chaperone PCu(A)C [Anaerolineales bacterium]
MKPAIFAIILFALLLAACASSTPQSLVIEDAWARPALIGQTSAIYFTIKNPNNAPDFLVQASSEVAMQTEIHNTLMDAQGVMKMEHQASVEIKGKDSRAFAPGGLHIMLMNLKQDLKVGDTIEVRLRFENSQEMTVQATVQEMP